MRSGSRAALESEPGRTEERTVFPLFLGTIAVNGPKPPRPLQFWHSRLESPLFSRQLRRRRRRLCRASATARGSERGEAALGRIEKANRQARNFFFHCKHSKVSVMYTSFSHALATTRYNLRSNSDLFVPIQSCIHSFIHSFIY